MLRKGERETLKEQTKEIEKLQVSLFRPRVEIYFQSESEIYFLTQ